MRVVLAIITIFTLAAAASAQSGHAAAHPVPAVAGPPAPAPSIEVTVDTPEATVPSAAGIGAGGRVTVTSRDRGAVDRSGGGALVQLLSRLDRVLDEFGGGVAFSPSDLAVLPVEGKALQGLVNQFEQVERSGTTMEAAERMLQMLCREFNLQLQSIGKLRVVTRWPTVVLNNQQVPVVGAMVVPQPSSSQVAGSGNSALQALGGGGQLYAGMQYTFPVAFPTAAELNRIPSLSNPINLKARNQPLAEFMAEVSKQSGQAIEIHPGVRKEITVTASIAGLSAREVVTSVAAQAGLLVQVQRRPTKEALEGAKQAATLTTAIPGEDFETVVFIVPLPDIRVNVPGGFAPGNVLVTPQPR